jgi:hypothetical protein
MRLRSSDSGIEYGACIGVERARGQRIHGV